MAHRSARPTAPARPFFRGASIKSTFAPLLPTIINRQLSLISGYTCAASAQSLPNALNICATIIGRASVAVLNAVFKLRRERNRARRLIRGEAGRETRYFLPTTEHLVSMINRSGSDTSWMFRWEDTSRARKLDDSISARRSPKAGQRVSENDSPTVRKLPFTNGFFMEAGEK